MASNVTQNSSDCDSLSANSTCTLYFTSNNGLPIEPGAYLITGTNSSTNRAVIAVDGDDYSISITSGSPLSLTVNGNAGSMVVRNDSSNTLYNINANFSGTALEGKVSQTGSTCPEGLAPGSDCTLSFTPGSQNVSQTSFPITGVSSDGASSATVNGQISINYINYYVYAMGSSYSIFRCKIDATTGLITSPSSCVPAGADGTFDAIYERVVFTVDQDANKFYAVIKGEGVEICTVNVDNGYLYTCSLYTNTGLSISVPSGVAVNYNPTYGQKYLYYVDENSDAIQGCSISSTNGTLSNCQSFISTTNPIQIAVNSAGTYAYVTTSSSVSFR